MAELESMLALMHDNWKVFRKHRPRGEYLPVGDIDGDCAECGSEWPCSVVREAIGGSSQYCENESWEEVKTDG